MLQRKIICLLIFSGKTFTLRIQLLTKSRAPWQFVSSQKVTVLNLIMKQDQISTIADSRNYRVFMHLTDNHLLRVYLIRFIIGSPWCHIIIWQVLGTAANQLICQDGKDLMVLSFRHLHNVLIIIICKPVYHNHTIFCYIMDWCKPSLYHKGSRMYRKWRN